MYIKENQIYLTPFMLFFLLLNSKYKRLVLYFKIPHTEIIMTYSVIDYNFFLKKIVAR